MFQCDFRVLKYREIPKMIPGVYTFQGPFWELIWGGAYIRKGLSTEGNLLFKIDWASLIVGRTFTVFALFYFVFGGQFPSTSPAGGGGGRGGLNLEGFIFSYTWRGLFSLFYAGNTKKSWHSSFKDRQLNSITFQAWKTDFLKKKCLLLKTSSETNGFVILARVFSKGDIFSRPWFVKY